MPGGNSTARPYNLPTRRAVFRGEGYEGEKEFFSGQTKRDQKQRDARAKTQKLIVKSGGLDPSRHITDKLSWFKD